jgi:hypothetical protein
MVGMYTRCLFCHGKLGANAVVEPFPVGRRLAFDAARGRLWVVCGGCGRWNLSPLEERWEAIEECERRFRGTRLHASTDHIGLTRLPEGLELVRIGRPTRPELALWRYGDELGGRRRKLAMLGIAGAPVVALGGYGIAAGGLAVQGAAAGIACLAVFLPYVVGYSLARAVARVNGLRVGLRLYGDLGDLIELRRRDLYKAELVPCDEEPGWGVQLPHQREQGREILRLTGDAAWRVATSTLTQLNFMGAARAEVYDALSLLDHPEGGVDYPQQLAARVRRDARRWRGERHLGLLNALPGERRLALEMALHEETERRALEGKLAALEDAWRDAEEIAAIADALLPSGELPDEGEPPALPPGRPDGVA